MDWILYFWQLPQHLLGLLLIRLLKAEKRQTYGLWYYWFDPKWSIARHFSGASLGMYIILPYKATDEMTVRHEMGHSRQSLLFGPLYLLIIGLPSLFNNLCDRWLHKKWLYEDRVKWYYEKFPEKWADKLGGVVRPWRS